MGKRTKDRGEEVGREGALLLLALNFFIWPASLSSPLKMMARRLMRELCQVQDSEAITKMEKEE